MTGIIDVSLFSESKTNLPVNLTFDVDKLRFASTGCKLHLLRITEGNLLRDLQNFECLKQPH